MTPFLCRIWQTGVTAGASLNLPPADMEMLQAEIKSFRLGKTCIHALGLRAGTLPRSPTPSDTSPCLLCTFVSWRMLSILQLFPSLHLSGARSAGRDKSLAHLLGCFPSQTGAKSCIFSQQSMAMLGRHTYYF